MLCAYTNFFPVLPSAWFLVSTCCAGLDQWDNTQKTVLTTAYWPCDVTCSSVPCESSLWDLLCRIQVWKIAIFSDVMEGKQAHTLRLMLSPDFYSCCCLLFLFVKEKQKFGTKDKSLSLQSTKFYSKISDRSSIVTSMKAMISSHLTVLPPSTHKLSSRYTKSP